MKFDPETIYDLAADTARFLVGELFRDRDEKNIESVYKRLLNKPEDFMIIPGLASVCKLLTLAGEQMGNEQAGKAAPALRRLIKSGTHEEWRGVFLDEQGRQIACDGFRAVRLNDPVKGIPEVKPFFDFEKMVERQRGDRHDLVTPDPGELRKDISRQRALRKKYPVWDFGEGLPAVDASYLLSMLTILPDATLFVYGGELSLVWFNSPSGDGLLMPVRKNSA